MAMNNFRQKTIIKVTLLTCFIIGAVLTGFSQSKASTQSPKFLILLETTANGLKLTGQEGCAWKELTFTLKQDQPQAIDQYGMTALNRDNLDNDKNASDFLFVIYKTKDGITLKGQKGTTWTDLKFSCQNGRCYQYIDTNGMTGKGS